MSTEGGDNDKADAHTLSIALLVRPSLDPFLALLALGIDALLGDAVLDAAEAGAGNAPKAARASAQTGGTAHAIGAR